MTVPVAEGERVYAALHSRIVVIDAHAAPGDGPSGLSAPLGTAIDTLAVREGIVVAGTHDLVVLDARDPRKIREMGRVALPGIRSQASAWVGDEVWLLDGRQRIVRFDVSRPEDPRRLPDWEDGVGGEDRGDIRFLADLSDGLAAIIQPSRNTAGLWVLRTLVTQEGGVPVLGDEVWLGFAPLGMVVRPGAIDIGQADGIVRSVSFDTSGALGVHEAEATDMPANTYHSFGAIGDGYWFLTQHATMIQMSRPGMPSQAHPIPSREYVLPVAVTVGSRVWVSGGSSSYWVEFENGSTTGPALGVATLHEVEPGIDGPWAMDRNGDLMRAESTDGDDWRLIAIDHNVRIEHPAYDMIRTGDGYVHTLQPGGVESLRFGRDGTLERLLFADVPGPIERSTLRLLNAEPNRVLAWRNVWSQPAQSTLVVHEVSTPSFEPQIIYPAREWGLSIVDAAMERAHIWLLHGPAGGMMLQAAQLTFEGDSDLVGEALPVPVGTILHGAYRDVVVAGAGRRVLLFASEARALPQLASEVELPGVVRRVARWANRLAIVWTSETGGGLTVVDIARREHPAILAEADLGSAASDVAFANGYIWSVDRALTAYELVPADGQTPDPGRTAQAFLPHASR